MADLEDKKLSPRNWEALLLATLARARDHMPTGPCDSDDLDRMTTSERHRAELGADIDNIMKLADERDP